LAEATFTDSTGSIPLDLWEDHIAILKSGKCYKMTSVQVKVWSNRKKITTTKKTIITETSDESLNLFLFNMTHKIR
jgi:ssDNA-binding replication factor A large subunit